MKEQFDMQDGFPIWKHLMNNGQKHKAGLRGGDYGKLAEWIGIREVKECIKFRNLITDIFPDIIPLSLSRRVRKKSKHLEYGDYCLQISYKDKNGTRYGKKILIIEIKHGHIQISQQQILRYSKYLIDPAAYFRKADEVKVIFMIFTKINTINASATYLFCEFNQELAYKIINAIPKEPEQNKVTDIFAFMNMDKNEQTVSH